MKYLRLYLFLLVLLSLAFTSCLGKKKTADSEYVYLSLEGKSYDELSLGLILEGNIIHRVTGQSEDGQNWKFHVPDSIYERHKFMSLDVQRNDSTVYRIALDMISPISDDTLETGNFTFGRSDRPAVLKYLHSDTAHQAPAFRYRDYISDTFLVTDSTENEELKISIEHFTMGYSMFDKAINDTLAYQEKLQKYIDFTQKYPDSHSLAASLANTLAFYETAEDISLIYKSLSKRNKKSYYGKIINEYITNKKFENMNLMVTGTKNQEPIINDFSKYNLVVFSASWCVTCHKQIPFLKEVYSELHDKLNIVYISIDKERSADNWSEHVQLEEIPWRTLMALPKQEEVVRKYFVYTIPYAMLVAPNGSFERLNLNKEEEREKLYQLIAKIKK